MELSSPTIINQETHQKPAQTSSLLEKEIGTHGLTKKILRRGNTWQTPCPGDEVEVHYGGHVENGSSLGSSRETGASFKFKLGQSEVIKGLDEGVATMKKGERAIFKVPPTLAYGEVGFPPLVPPHSTLIFDIELISWSTIRDLTEDGGVLKKIITEGEGWGTPKDGDEASVKYEAMLEDGTIVSKSEIVEFHVGNDGFEEDESEEIVTRNRRSNNNITILLELLSWRRVVDVLGDKKILKKVISAGEGFVYPNEGSLVKVIYVGKQEDGSIFEQKGSDEEPFEYMCLEGQVDENLDKAIMTMKKGEKALIFILPDDMQGNGDVTESNFGNPKLIYEVELLDFTKEKPFWKMETREKIEACEKKKQEGKALFQAGKFWLASNKYEKAAKCIEFNHSFSEEEKRLGKALLVSCNLNNAACKLKLEDYVGAAELCTKVLEFDPDNIKALFRRTQAYLHTSDLDKAHADSRRALTIDPHNRDVKHLLQVIKTKQKEHAMYQAQLFGTMISKMA
ncbi:Peptidyl-prolyl cis-trans isomerase FKBP65 [Bienertia sinuspersici]